MITSLKNGLTGLSTTLATLPPNEKKLCIYFQAISVIHAIHSMYLFNIKKSVSDIKRIDPNSNIDDLEPMLNQIKDMMLNMAENIKLI